MIVKNFLDLDKNDLTVKKLATLSQNFGMIDLVEVVMQIANMGAEDGAQVMFVINEKNAAEAIADLLACAVVNYGCWIHEEITVEIMVGDEAKPIRFFRQQPAETYKKAAENYLSHASMLIEKYFPTPAE